MRVRMRALAALAMLGILAVVSLLPAGASRSQAQEPPASPHVVMIESKLCTALLIALRGVDSTSAALRCLGLQSPSYLESVAGWFGVGNGTDDPIIDPGTGDRIDEACEDDPSTASVDEADSNHDGVDCDAGDKGVDDEIEVQSQIDMRDDGKLDGKYTLRASDFAAVDLDANQLHQQDGLLWVLVFNDGYDDPARFDTDEGLIRVDSAQPGNDQFQCGSVDIPNVESSDEDCNNDGISGDGVKVVSLIPGVPAPPRGPANLRVTEIHSDMVVPFTVVGELWEITFTVLKPVATTGTSKADCSFDLSASGVAAALSNPNMAIVLVHGLDKDGTQIASTLLDWSVDDPAKAFTFLPSTPTVDLGAFGVGFPQAICGNKTPGTVKVTAETSAQAATLDPGAFQFPVSASFDVTVLGPPANLTLTAAPAQLPCDGVATSTITAQVTDAGGNNVADGTEVRFNAQVLATVNPLVAKTAGGTATSVVAPLAGATVGSPVTVSAGSLQSSILVSCSSAAPSTPSSTGGGAAGGGAAPTGITGPNTGTGGSSPGQNSGLTWYVGAGLLAAAAILAAVRRLLARLES